MLFATQPQASRENIVHNLSNVNNEVYFAPDT